MLLYVVVIDDNDEDSDVTHGFGVGDVLLLKWSLC
jgi:hypothetical protein